MKLIIDIPDDWEKHMGEMLDFQIVDFFYGIIRNGTPISDNATNGQVIQTLFKPNRIERTDDDVIVENYDFSKEWWNAPYQKGGKPDCDTCEKAWTDECKRAECYEHNYKYYQKGGKE